MQLKLHKEKRKSDKAVLDSQERAYWRTFRPPPGSTSILEQHWKPQVKSRRKSSRDYKQEVRHCASGVQQVIENVFVSGSASKPTAGEEAIFSETCG